MRKIQEIQQKESRLMNASGMAPAITQSTAATDNLAAVMKNAVVFLAPSFRVIGAPTPRKPDDPGSDGQRTSAN